ncbi:putative exported protein [Ehrlichia ruminantium]|uniref:Thiol:disulfide interchange protein DsbD N-terminal domain-containing protein n=1 Tax=Ehrlichia ruminantium (strain Welgevonden) TaxID=254945 RepID=A0A0H3M7Z5_EHRRW|nr:protein-disulfide reductase DsbD domain-containing protein [Ehrlichia ruminantium]KYW92248.1 hypothetical protein AUR40_02905 [Ehrlichia ruminantium]QLK50332.1 hypothetical protein FDZ68_01415 [Ehrlichia ruminantium]QLK51256.1 hypothetical protein FDZ66_01420 [Ehrlichia ruminantium]QLK52181.1 hypothetical protein FDZ65_01430 [Ehrlichia ruminantium]QLK53091.1 hypothetical protein FDZ64_01415 [Ehrlichia ruminantium]
MLRLSFIFIVLITLLTYQNGYSAKSPDPVNIKLIVGSMDMKNRTINIGVEFRIQDGWHIYYKSPGDLGLPTVFQWQENIFKDVQIHWPQPIQHTDTTSNNIFHSNVYKDIVMFPISFALKHDNLNTKELSISLRIKYAVCKDVCIPQEKVIILNRFLQDYVNQENLGLINFWKKK